MKWTPFQWKIPKWVSILHSHHNPDLLTTKKVCCDNNMYNNSTRIKKNYIGGLFHHVPQWNDMQVGLQVSSTVQHLPSINHNVDCCRKDDWLILQGLRKPGETFASKCVIRSRSRLKSRILSGQEHHHTYLTGSSRTGMYKNEKLSATQGGEGLRQEHILFWKVCSSPQSRLCNI